MLPELLTVTIAISTLATQASAWGTSLGCIDYATKNCPYKCSGVDYYQGTPCESDNSNSDKLVNDAELAGGQADLGDM